jgi:hypothetical protein
MRRLTTERASLESPPRDAGQQPDRRHHPHPQHPRPPGRLQTEALPRFALRPNRSRLAWPSTGAHEMGTPPCPSVSGDGSRRCSTVAPRKNSGSATSSSTARKGWWRAPRSRTRRVGHENRGQAQQRADLRVVVAPLLERREPLPERPILASEQPHAQRDEREAEGRAAQHASGRPDPVVLPGVFHEEGEEDDEGEGAGSHEQLGAEGGREVRGRPESQKAQRWEGMGGQRSQRVRPAAPPPLPLCAGRAPTRRARPGSRRASPPPERRPRRRGWAPRTAGRPGKGPATPGAAPAATPSAPRPSWARSGPAAPGARRRRSRGG